MDSEFRLLKYFGGFTTEELGFFSTMTVLQYVEENEWKNNSQLGFVNTGLVKPVCLCSAVEEEALGEATTWQPPMGRLRYDFGDISREVLMSNAAHEQREMKSGLRCRWRIRSSLEKPRSMLSRVKWSTGAPSMGLDSGIGQNNRRAETQHVVSLFITDSCLASIY